jgi:ParB-like chromosome segregation protein Spo0J
MNVRLAKLSELHQDPSNARKHEEKNLDSIAGSLKTFGQVEPLVVQKSTGKVIGGNGRLEVMKRDGLSECHIVEVDVDDTQATALGIALNRTSELAAWDDDTLAKLLESLPSDLLEATGFTDTDLQELLDTLAPATVEEDDVPEPLPEAVSRPGDQWLLGEHRLLCGDSTKREDVERVMAGEETDLVVTDPPYGLAYQADLTVEQARALHRRTDGLDLVNDDLDREGTLTLVRGSLALAREHMRSGAAFYVCSPSGDMSDVIRAALADAGLSYRQVVIWAKDVFVMGRQDYHWRHEDILYGWKEGAGHYFVDDRTQDTVWEIPRPKRSEEHPTMKPVALIAKAIGNSSCGTRTRTGRSGAATTPTPPSAWATAPCCASRPPRSPTTSTGRMCTARWWTRPAAAGRKPGTPSVQP